MKKITFFLILFLLVCFYTIPVPVSALDVYPSVTDTDFIIYIGNKNIDKNLTTFVFPTTFQVSYSGNEEKWFGISLFFPPEDTSKFKYEIISSEWSFVKEPNQIYEGNGKFLLTYFVSVSAVPYAVGGLFGTVIVDVVRIVVSCSIYIRIDEPPTEPLTIKLSDIVGMSKIPIKYRITIERTEPRLLRRTIEGDVYLITDNIYLKFYKLFVNESYIELKGGSGYGNFEENGYIMISPLGDIVINLCLDPPYIPSGVPPFVFEGKLVYRNQYQVSETLFKLDTRHKPSCRYFVISDVTLIPGSYKGNNSLPILLRSGALEITIPIEVDVPGTMIAVSSPIVFAKPVNEAGSYRWEIEIQAPVNIVSYGHSGSIKIVGSIRIDNSNINVDCSPLEFTSPSLYECKIYSDVPPYNPSNVYKGDATLNVYIWAMGTQYNDDITTNVIFLSHSSIQFIVSSIYRYLIMIILGLLLTSVILYGIQFIFGSLGIDLFKTSSHDWGILSFNPTQMMMTMSILTILVMGLPYAYSIMFSGLCYMITDPDLSEFRRAMGCPISIVGRPEDIIAKFFSYYDLLLIRIRSDYMVWVNRSIIEFGLRLVELFVIFMALLSIAIALMVSMNSPVAGSLASAVLTFGFSIISIFITLVPTLGLVLVFASLVEIILVVVSILILILLPLGALLLLAPSPSIQVYGENMLGASFFYLLLSPGLAPIIYALYMQVSKSLRESIALLSSQVGPLGIPLVGSFYPPIDLIARISGYIVLSSIVLGIVVLANIYFLTRTGIMTSIGESLARIIRR
ncbi:MAG: hypothetical protein QXL19_05860 [Ignisphaera sp.]